VDRVVQVVTVFVAHNGRVFLIRRSERVGTYRGFWAGISGYVERLPIQQARTEAAEEAGLGGDSLRLRGIGVPLSVDDPERGSSWMVFPFLFETDHPERIMTDWESSESRWVDPSEVGEYRTVPGLADVLKRVWPPFGSDALWTEFESVAADTARGATDLALSGLKAIAAHVEPPDVRRAITAFAASRPSMGVFPHLAARLISSIDAGLDYREIASKLSSELVDATSKSAEQAAARLKGSRRVFTHSRSRAVEQTILSWVREAEKPEVIVTESRPGLEGIGLAESLSRAGVRVTLITDAQMGHFVPGCDAVLVGCDAITSSGAIVNKVGTKLAVMAAREASVPAYAVAQTFKIVPEGWPEVVEEQEPGDVYSTNEFRVRNVIFDSTPVEWFTGVITESGELTQEILLRSLGRDSAL
jgi:translation initiation factor 2B subunit (eIF-2B alpha/beta/delta family)/ADP-ribose pyrophosphatase YjhB (NUDIX family)